MPFDQLTVPQRLRQLRRAGYGGLAYLGGRPAYVYSPLMRPGRARRTAGGTRHGS
jgi:hypothetical protein